MDGREPRGTSVLLDAFGSHTLDNKARCVLTSRKIKAYIKRQYAIMAAALLDAEDGKLLPAKKRLFLNGWMQHKKCGIQNQLNEEQHENSIDQYRRLLGVPQTTCATAQAAS